MHFTREPIIETVITPKEGYKLVVRSSKGTSHEEFSVDALQVVLVGAHCFYRCLEKPKPFFVPACDYEIIETRDTRIGLKMPAKEKELSGIKIAGGRETSLKAVKETKEEPSATTMLSSSEEKVEERIAPSERSEKRRRRFRKQRGAKEEPTAIAPPQPRNDTAEEQKTEEAKNYIIPPPLTLISESISRYREQPNFAGAFYSKEEEGAIEEPAPLLSPLFEEKEKDPEDSESDLLNS